MIAWLTGKLQRKAADSVIINVGGVGYQVAVPVSTLNAIADRIYDRWSAGLDSKA